VTHTVHTRQALADAMRSLMVEKPFPKIRVEDICSRACTSRKSFYYYYKDKYDLVNWIFTQDFDEVLSGKEYENGWDFFTVLFTCFYRNRPFYIPAFSVEGQNSFSDYFTEVLYPIALRYFRELFVMGDLNDFYAHFFTDSLKVSIVHWLTDYPDMKPEEYIEHLKVAVMGVARELSEDSLGKAIRDAERSGVDTTE